MNWKSTFKETNELFLKGFYIFIAICILFIPFFLLLAGFFVIIWVSLMISPFYFLLFIPFLYIITLFFKIIVEVFK